MLTALIPGLFWAWLFLACSQDWTHSENYSYGWFAAALSVYFLWKRMETSDVTPCPKAMMPVAWGVLTLVCVAVLPLELLRQTPIYWRVFHWGIYLCVVGSTTAVALMSGGMGQLKAVFFPLLFLATAVPWPTLIEQPITIGLMHTVAGGIAELLPLFGIPVRQQGTTLALPNCVVGVEEACSGIRSLQSAVMLGLAFGELFHLGIKRRIFLLALACAGAVAANAGRTLGLTLAGLKGGPEGIAASHDILGLLSLGSLILLTGAGGWLLRRLKPAAPAPPRSQKVTAHPRPLPATAIICLGIAVVGFAGAHAWFLLNEWRSHREGLPYVGISGEAEVLPLPGSLVQTLAPTEGAFVRWVSEEGTVANGYHFFWSAEDADAEKFYHRPDVCMPGSGWKLSGEIRLIDDSDLGVKWLALPYELSGRKALMLWASWLDGEQMTFNLEQGGTTQQKTLLSLLQNGKRRFSFEVAALLIPYSGNQPPISEATRLANVIFRRMTDKIRSPDSTIHQRPLDQLKPEALRVVSSANLGAAALSDKGFDTH